jgi:hypothetical protein
MRSHVLAVISALARPMGYKSRLKCSTVPIQSLHFAPCVVHVGYVVLGDFAPVAGTAVGTDWPDVVRVVDQLASVGVS